jgi:hypothetical protein
MLSNPFLVRELIPQITVDRDNPTNQNIINRIRDVDSKISLWLSPKYKNNPIQPNDYLTGTITVNKDSGAINGTSTTFASLQPGQVIQIVSTGEVLQIDQINSDTLITSNSNAFYDATGSSFWVVPDELVTASKWMTGHVITMLYFSEKTLNQDNVEKFDTRMQNFAGDIIKELKSGLYLNTDLMAQSSDKAPGRLIYINTDNDIRERVDSNLDIINSSSFI